MRSRLALSNAKGLTLIEILIAIVVLGVGIAALVATSGNASRMLGAAKVETRAAQAASDRMEALRLAAQSTSPKCTSRAFASGGPVLAGDMTESWVVPTTGKVRRVRVTITYLTVKGTRVAELETMMSC
jgi:prepilin-type N-terminal cleavage/methylation domain-containing protein